MAATNPTPTPAAKAQEAGTEPREQKITTFLWFDNNAEEAANFYASISQTPESSIQLVMVTLVRVQRAQS